MERQAGLFGDVQPPEPAPLALVKCPACRHPHARIEPRPDTIHEVQLRCPACRYHTWPSKHWRERFGIPEGDGGGATPPASGPPDAGGSVTLNAHGPDEDTHMPKISEEFASNFLKASDLGGKELILTIETAEIETFNDEGGKRKKVVLTFCDHDQKMILNMTNRDAVVELYGDDTDDWVGEKIILYPTRVPYGGKKVDAIRVRDRKPTAKGKPAKPAKREREPGSDDDEDDDDSPF